MESMLLLVLIVNNYILIENLSWLYENKLISKNYYMSLIKNVSVLNRNLFFCLNIALSLT